MTPARSPPARNAASRSKASRTCGPATSSNAIAWRRSSVRCEFKTHKCAERVTIVMKKCARHRPRKRGIKYSANLRAARPETNLHLGFLDRPVKPGDDDQTYGRHM